VQAAARVTLLDDGAATAAVRAYYGTSQFAPCATLMADLHGSLCFAVVVFCLFGVFVMARQESVSPFWNDGDFFVFRVAFYLSAAFLCVSLVVCTFFAWLLINTTRTHIFAQHSFV
jgi:hypothetical protein